MTITIKTDSPLVRTEGDLVGICQALKQATEELGYVVTAIAVSEGEEVVGLGEKLFLGQ